MSNASKNATIKFSAAKNQLLRTTALTVAGLLTTTAAYAEPGAFEVPNSDASGMNWTAPNATPGVSFSQSLGNLTVHAQTVDQAFIDWNSFNIGKQATTEFQQKNAGSLAVNRVTGQDPTQIYGTLKANGRIVILDQNGVFFDGASHIDVAGIVASTGTLDAANQAALMNGQPFTLTNIGANPNAKIENRGTINVADAGLLAFVAPYVSNSGVINAKLGKVALAAGEKVTVDLTGDGLITLAADAKLQKAYVENAGTINAAGGLITMTAGAAASAVDSIVNMKGVAQANSFSTQNGKIVLASAGEVKVTGTATVDGANGAGEISVKAENVCIAGTGTLSANATQNGNGGAVYVVAQNAAIINGSLSAKGGAEGGDGGFIETSGLNYLSTSGIRVDTTAGNGATGTWLIDPLDILIIGGKGDGHDNSGAAGPGTSGGWQNTGDGGAYTTPTSDSASPYTIYESEIEGQSATTNITIQARRSINTDFGSSGDGYVNLATGKSLTIETRNNTGGSENNGVIDLSNLGFATLGAGSITVTASTGSGTGNIVIGNLSAQSGSITVSTDNGSITVGGNGSDGGTGVSGGNGGKGDNAGSQNGINGTLGTNNSFSIGSSGGNGGDALVSTTSGTITLSASNSITLGGFGGAGGDGGVGGNGGNGGNGNDNRKGGNGGAGGNGGTGGTGGDGGNGTLLSVNGTINLISNDINFTGANGGAGSAGGFGEAGKNGNGTKNNPSGGGIGGVGGTGGAGGAGGIGGTGSISTGGLVTIERYTDGKISLGDATGGLNISQAELAKITAGSLKVGGSKTSSMAVGNVNLQANVAGLTTLLVGKQDGDFNDLDFTGTNAFNGLTADVNDDVHLDDNATLASNGAVTFSTDNNDGTVGDFNMDAGSKLTTSDDDVTVNTLAVNIAGTVDATGGNILLNNSGKFTGAVNSLNTTGDGTITLNQWAGGSIDNAVQALNNTGSGQNTVNIGAGVYDENVAANQKNLKLNGGYKGGTTTLKGTITASAQNVNIDPITFDGTNSDDYAIVATGAGANGLVVDGNTFRNYKTAAIRIDGSAGTSTVTGNVFEGSTKVGVLSTALSGTHTLNIEGDNTFGSNGSKLVNAVKLGTVSGATVNIKGTNGTAWASGDGFLFGGLVSNGANVNITGGNTVKAGGDGIAFRGDVSGANVSITGANVTGTTGGVAFRENVLNGAQVTLSSSTVTATSQDGVVFDKDINGGSTKVTISGNSITGQADGVDVEKVTGGATLKVADNTLIRGVTGDGVQFDSLVSGANVEISGNGITAAKNGVSFNGVTGGTVVVRTNTITAGTNGVYGDAAQGLQVLSNVISGFGSGNGVYLDDGSNNADVFGNTVTGSGSGTGIRVEASTGVEIGKEGAANRNTVSNVGTGVYVSGADNAVVNNSITTKKDGVVADAANGLDVYNNDITGKNSSTGTGVKVTNSSDVNVGGEDVTKTTWSWSQFKFVTTVLAERDNRIASFDNGAVITGGNANNVVNNAIGNVHDGIQISGSTNADVLNNVITGNSDIGIDIVSGSHGATVEGNAVDHFGIGVKVHNSDDVTIEDNTLTQVEDGIVARFANGLRILKNGLTGLSTSKGTGIDVQDSSAVVIGGWDLVSLLGGTVGDGNTVSGFRDGIYADDVSGLKIQGNRVEGGSRGTGIKVEDSEGAEIGGFGSLLSFLKSNYVSGFDYGIVSTDSDNATIAHNLVTDSDEDGITVTDSDEVAIEANAVQGAGGDGIRVASSKHVYVKYNDVTNSGDDGIEVSDAWDVEIKHNDIDDSGSNGVWVDGSKDILVHGNDITDSDNNGVKIYDSRKVTVEHNDIDESGDNGVYVHSSENVGVEHNDIDDSGDNGVKVAESDEVTVKGNDITDSDEDGVNVSGSKHVFVKYNDIDSSGDDGVDISGNLGGWFNFSDDDIFVIGNDIDDSRDNGVEVSDTWDLGIWGNDIDDSGDNGIQLDNVKKASIARNLITGSDDDGVDIRDSRDVTVWDNGIYGSDENGVQIFGSRDIDVLGNRIFGGNRGVDVGFSRDVLIDGNRIGHYDDAGVQVAYSGDVTISDNRITGNGAFPETGPGDEASEPEIFAFFESQEKQEQQNETVGIRLGQAYDPFSGNWGDVNIVENTIRNNATGLQATAWNNHLINVDSNTFDNNFIGLHIASGLVDLTGTRTVEGEEGEESTEIGNLFIGGHTAMLFDGLGSEGSEESEGSESQPYNAEAEFWQATGLSLAGDTLGSTVFEEQSNWYVYLQNGAFFNPGTPTVIDGFDATYDGVSGGLMTLAQLMQIESMIHDFDDNTTLGQIFAGFTLNNIDNNDIFDDVNGANFLKGKGSILFVGNNSGGNTGNLNNIEPAAGEGTNPEDIEPSAGDTVTCWGDAAGALAGGGNTVMDLDADPKALIESQAACGSDDGSI